MGKFASPGFTLVEILIAITVISMAVALGLPNLRKYSEDQELPNTTSDLVRVLRQAQFSAMSHVFCDNGNNPSSQWRVVIDGNTSSYWLSAECQTGNPYTKYSKTTPNVRFELLGCGLYGSIIFKDNTVSFECGAGTSPFSIRATKNGVSKTITISTGGSIDVN